MTPAESLIVRLLPVPAPADLAREWTALEDRADGSFFTSWAWIGPWLGSLPRRIRPRLLRVDDGTRAVGLGLLVERREWHAGILPSRVFVLNATGDPYYDELTIEYNGLLAERGQEADVLCAARRALLSRGGWDEWRFDGVLGDAPAATTQGEATTLMVSRTRPCHAVNLQVLEPSVDAYLAGLGPKTRYNIRRSLREYEALGGARIEEAGTIEEALSYLRGLKAMHQARWVSKGKAGSFGNAYFDGFHARLVAESARGSVQLLRLRAGDTVVGYLYNLVYRGHVYNYATGFDYSACPHQNRPGLVAHALAVEHNLRAGHAVYDFMAGDGEYKQALGTSSSSMCWFVVRRNRRRFALERALRAAKRAWPATARRAPWSEAT